MFSRFLLLAAFLLIGSVASLRGADAPFFVTSPDGQIVVSLEPLDGRWTYRLQFRGRQLIDSSPVGYVDSCGTAYPSAYWQAATPVVSSRDTVWYPVWGKRAVVPDCYRQLELPLSDAATGSRLSLVLRVYNDGFAFRYRNVCLPDRPLKESTRFGFSGDYVAWFYNGERHNIGPERLTASDGERLPVMTVDCDTCFLAVHEADLEWGEPLRLYSRAGECAFSVLSEPRRLKAGCQSAWRVVMCARQIGALVDSHLLELLNPAPQGDFSWVKPGVALWDWRINGARWEDFTYTMSYPSWKRMADFAAREGFTQLVLDANWYGAEFAESSDPVKGGQAADVRRLIAYAHDRGVGIWLYLNDVGGSNYPIEETLAQYERWGATGVKYGFMAGTPEQKNEKTRRITELCARHHLMIDFHDYPVHPYGQMRTWPNAVTREYCKAQLDGHDIFYPSTFVTSVFVNMLAGPLDMNNGMFDLRQGPTTRVDNNQEVPSTVVAEAARCLITFSGVTILPDIPEYYERHPALLRFLSAQRQPWQESRTLSGSIGEYIVMMRQSRDKIYLMGAATNEEARTLDVSLDFLPEGKFQAEITEDAPDSHYLHNREKAVTSLVEVSRASKLRLHLAPGGGACVLIRSAE